MEAIMNKNKSEESVISFGKSNILKPVYLNLKIIGFIKKVELGYQYFPKNSKTGGKIFNNMFDCKSSLY